MQAGSLPEKFAKKLKGQEKTIELMRRLVTIVRDVPLKEFDLEQTVTSRPDAEKLLGLFKAYEFKQLIKKYEAKGEVAAGSPNRPFTSADVKKLPKSTPSLREVTSLAQIESKRVAVILDVKATDLFGGGIARVVVSDDAAVYSVNEPQVSDLEALKQFVLTCKVVVIHDLKAMMHALARAGLDAETMFASAEIVDTLLAAYLISSNVRDFSFEEVVQDHLGLAITSTTSGGERAALMFKLADKLVARLQTDGMAALYRDIEAPLVPVLFKMERDGVLIDKQKLVELSGDFAKTLESLTKKIYKLVGKEFNINSWFTD
jgi:DNA polymerase-1